MNDLNNRNVYHVMEIKLAQIAARYLLCKQIMGEKSYQVSCGDSEEDNPFSTYIVRVEKAYDGLDETHRQIINNDFFYQNTYPFWWESCFSKSSYYRLKNTAMKKFLRTFASA